MVLKVLKMTSVGRDSIPALALRIFLASSSFLDTMESKTARSRGAITPLEWRTNVIHVNQ